MWHKQSHSMMNLVVVAIAALFFTCAVCACVVSLRDLETQHRLLYAPSGVSSLRPSASNVSIAAVLTCPATCRALLRPWGSLEAVVGPKNVTETLLRAFSFVASYDVALSRRVASFVLSQHLAPALGIAALLLVSIISAHGSLTRFLHTLDIAANFDVLPEALWQLWLRGVCSRFVSVASRRTSVAARRRARNRALVRMRIARRASHDRHRGASECTVQHPLGMTHHERRALLVHHAMVTLAVRAQETRAVKRAVAGNLDTLPVMDVAWAAVGLPGAFLASAVAVDLLRLATAVAADLPRAAALWWWSDGCIESIALRTAALPLAWLFASHFVFKCLPHVRSARDAVCLLVAQLLDPLVPAVVSLLLFSSAAPSWAWAVTIPACLIVERAAVVLLPWLASAGSRTAALRAKVASKRFHAGRRRDLRDLVELRGRTSSLAVSWESFAVRTAQFMLLVREGIEPNPGPAAQSSAAAAATAASASVNPKLAAIQQRGAERKEAMQARRAATAAKHEALKAAQEEKANAEAQQKAARDAANAEKRNKRSAATSSVASTFTINSSVGAPSKQCTTAAPPSVAPSNNDTFSVASARPAAAADAAARNQASSIDIGYDTAAGPLQGGFILEQHTDNSSFFAFYLAKQTTAINTSTWLIVTEDFEELLPDGTWSAPRRRTVAIRPVGAHMTVKSTNLLDEARAAEAGFPGEAAKVKQRQRITPVFVYKNAEMYDSATNEFSSYGEFPLLPGRAEHGPNFRTVYNSCRFATEVERNQLDGNERRVPSDAAAVLTHEEQGADMWQTLSDTSDEVVEQILENYGEHMKLNLRASDGLAREAFRHLAAKIVSGYNSLAVASAGRMAIIRRLLALPRMYMRALIGRASPRVRAKHERLQLSGVMCVQRACHTPAQQQPAKQLTAAEFADKCVRSAFALVRQCYIGKASSALVRTPAPHIDTEQKISDLRALHPGGTEPTMTPSASATPFTYNESHVPIPALRKSVKSHMHGSAPGPDGWTFEMLYDALERDAFAEQFQAILIDLCNGNVDEFTAQFLAASTLVGIPKGEKASDGTRPLACGGVFMKVAGTFALDAAKSTTASIFKGSQFGCSYKGGGDHIIHATRRFVRTGERPGGAVAGSKRVLVTIDLTNAFNTPTRQAMWEAVRNIPQLHGIFKVNYGRHSALHVAGCGEKLSSQRGARQGTVDGPVIFSLVLQEILNSLNALPGVQALSYLDDCSLLCDSVEHANEAVRVYNELATKLGMKIKASKCEVLFCEQSATCSLAGTHMSEFRVVPVLKLLGASVGRNDGEEIVHLNARMLDKHALFFERLRSGASPQFFTLLRQCGIPQLGHAVRVHSPDVSRRLCQVFDARVEDTICYWSAMPRLSERQRLIMALPRNFGGFGLSRMELVAPAAYHASLTAALQNARRVNSQGSLTAAIYSDLRLKAVSNDSELLRHLEVHALDGSDAGLSFHDSTVHPDVYSAMLRLYLMGDVPTMAAKKEFVCPGCRRSFATGGEWGQHAASCTIAKGGFVTRRHNAVVHLLRVIMGEAAWQPELQEPRDVKLFTCQCGVANLPEHLYKLHIAPNGGGCKHARTKPAHASGPDVRYHPQGFNVVAVADVTIRNACSRVHAAEDVTAIFAAAAHDKLQRYGAMCNAVGQQLITLAATSNGHMSQEFIKLCNQLADATLRDRRTVRNRLSAVIAHGSGAARLAMEELAGHRPPTIEMQQVALLRSFAVGTLGLGADEDQRPANPQLAPVLAPTPSSQSLDQLIANGVATALRESLPQLTEHWVRAARRLDDEQRARSVERRRLASANALLPSLLPAPSARTIDLDAETLAEHRRIHAQHDRDIADAEHAARTAAANRDTTTIIEELAILSADVAREAERVVEQELAAQQAMEQEIADDVAHTAAVDACTEKWNAATEHLTAAAVDAIEEVQRAAEHAASSMSQARAKSVEMSRARDNVRAKSVAACARLNEAEAQCRSTISAVRAEARETLSRALSQSHTAGDDDDGSPAPLQVLSPAPVQPRRAITTTEYGDDGETFEDLYARDDEDDDGEPEPAAYLGSPADRRLRLAHFAPGVADHQHQQQQQRRDQSQSQSYARSVAPERSPSRAPGGTTPPPPQHQSRLRSTAPSRSVSNSEWMTNQTPSQSPAARRPAAPVPPTARPAATVGTGRNTVHSPGQVSCISSTMQSDAGSPVCSTAQRR